jgi:hypothetical protein
VDRGWFGEVRGRGCGGRYLVTGVCSSVKVVNFLILISPTSKLT